MKKNFKPTVKDVTVSLESTGVKISQDQDKRTGSRLPDTRLQDANLLSARRNP